MQSVEAYYDGKAFIPVKPIRAQKNQKALITLFESSEQAEQQAPDYTVHMTSLTDPHEKVAARLVREAGLRELAFEDDEVTVATFAALQKAMEGVSFAPEKQVVEALRQIKDESEIALIEKACQIASRAFEVILGMIKPGMTELEVRFALENEMYSRGAEKIAFDTIIAAGANGALPHAIPGNRTIEKGDLLTMDFGAKVGGYCSDMTRTVAVGKPDDEKRRVYDTVLEAHLLAMDAIRPGASCREVDRVARDHIDAAGYRGRFGHGLGHSLGLDIHEEPRFNTVSKATLEKGVVMTNEPGIYLPGRCGCRIEDTVLVTPDGCRRLTDATKELIIL